jgi:cob(I)alamin adenosyltransferase
MLLSHGRFYMSELAATQRVLQRKNNLVIAKIQQIRLHFHALNVYNPPRMELPIAGSGIATPRNVIGLSVLFLLIAAVFGVLNGQKVKSLRTMVVNADASRDEAERRRVAEKKDMSTREATATLAQTKAAEAETIANKVQADLTQLQAEKADLQTKLQANQAEVASLQKRIEEAGGAKPAADNPGAASPTEMQAQLDEARKQLENAERENAFLSEKIRTTQEHQTSFEQDKKRRQTASGHAGVRGTVLAVNQAYNFVVLNLGGRQGVEPNAEMLVLRDGVLIGKIRVSSVEPSTAIGDIITSSLERGVQVQPGDVVVYGGSNS